MLCAVIAAANEATTIKNVLVQTHRAGVERCIVVVNGSADETCTLANQAGRRLFRDFSVVRYTDRCGPDLPHAIGLVRSQRLWPDTDWFLLLDGDLAGAFGPGLADFITSAVGTESAAAWTHSPSTRLRTDQQLWRSVLAHTRPSLLFAEPAQVPRLIRRSLLMELPLQAFFHPGFWLAHCARRSHIEFAAIPFDARILGNKVRSWRHQERMQETLIGDALEGIRLLLKKKPHRCWQGKVYLGYHPERRFDLLLEAEQSLQIFV